MGCRHGHCDDAHAVARHHRRRAGSSLPGGTRRDGRLGPPGAVRLWEAAGSEEVGEGTASTPAPLWGRVVARLREPPLAQRRANQALAQARVQGQAPEQVAELEQALAQAQAQVAAQTQAALASLRRLALSMADRLSQWASGGPVVALDAEAGGDTGVAESEVVREVRRNVAPAPDVQTVVFAPAPTGVAQVGTVGPEALLGDLVPGIFGPQAWRSGRLVPELAALAAGQGFRTGPAGRPPAVAVDPRVPEAAAQLQQDLGRRMAVQGRQRLEDLLQEPVVLTSDGPVRSVAALTEGAVEIFAEIARAWLHPDDGSAASTRTIDAGQIRPVTAVTSDANGATSANRTTSANGMISPYHATGPTPLVLGLAGRGARCGRAADQATAGTGVWCCALRRPGLAGRTDGEPDLVLVGRAVDGAAGVAEAAAGLRRSRPPGGRAGQVGGHVDGGRAVPRTGGRDVVG